MLNGSNTIPVGDTTESPDFESALNAGRLEFWGLAVQLGFLEHEDPQEALDAAAQALREFDARILAFAEETAAKLKAASA